MTSTLRKRSLENYDEIVIIGDKPNKKQKMSCGQNVRKQYPTYFKARVIHAVEGGDWSALLSIQKKAMAKDL